MSKRQEEKKGNGKKVGYRKKKRNHGYVAVSVKKLL